MKQKIFFFCLPKKIKWGRIKVLIVLMFFLVFSFQLWSLNTSLRYEGSNICNFCSECHLYPFLQGGKTIRLNLFNFRWCIDRNRFFVRILSFPSMLLSFFVVLHVMFAYIKIFYLSNEQMRHMTWKWIFRLYLAKTQYIHVPCPLCHVCGSFILPVAFRYIIIKSNERCVRAILFIRSKATVFRLI